MKTKRFFSILCLTVALSVNSLPVYAQSGLELIIEGLKAFNSPVAQRILLDWYNSQSQTTSQPQAFSIFSDGEWVVDIQQDGNDYIYKGVNLNNKAAIQLRNAAIQGNEERVVLSWNNSGTIYQIAYQPNDPGFARLQVFEGSELLLDRLLTRYVVNR